MSEVDKGEMKSLLADIKEDEYLAFEDGKPVKKDLYITNPKGFQLSSGCMMNGIPSECVPEDVFWDDTNSEWKVLEEVDVEINATISEEEEDWKNESLGKDLLEYPCWTSEILYTKEYYMILEWAGISQEEMDQDLDWKMRVLRWIHQSNVETVIRYTSRREKGEILPSTVNEIWEKIGRRVGRRAKAWKRHNDDSLAREIQQDSKKERLFTCKFPDQIEKGSLDLQL